MAAPGYPCESDRQNATAEQDATISQARNKKQHLQTMRKKQAYAYEELIKCGQGKLFGPGNAQLPLPPMLMFDRIVRIDADGGAFGRGRIIAELDVTPDLWFFACHFDGDPVMPGCLGLDAMWQLVGFYLGWIGGTGRGRALGAGDVKFSGQATPQNKLVLYKIDVKRVIARDLLSTGFANGIMEVDGRNIYSAKNLRVGLFTSTEDV